jgi:hypothetical protein
MPLEKRPVEDHEGYGSGDVEIDLRLIGSEDDRWI